MKSIFFLLTFIAPPSFEDCQKNPLAIAAVKNGKMMEVDDETPSAPSVGAEATAPPSVP